MKRGREEKKQYGSACSITIWCSMLRMNNLLLKNYIKNVHHSDLFISLFDLNSLSLHYICRNGVCNNWKRCENVNLKWFSKYVFQEELSNNLQSWKCELWRKGQCKAKVKLHMNGELVREINKHIHPPSQDQIEVKKNKNIDKTKVTSNTWHTPTNFGSCPLEYIGNSYCQPAAN